MSKDSGIIQTFTGVLVRPFELRLEDVRMDDIIHALSNLCRFNGHTRGFYSVAQHSVLALELARNLFPGVTLVHEWALMHDAAEAYIGDVPRPIKGLIPGLAEIERHILEVVGEALGLGVYPQLEIDHIDEVMLATERRDLLAPAEWPNPPRASAAWSFGRIDCWAPLKAEREMKRAWRSLPFWLNK